MTIKILSLITVLAYSMIVSQSFMYILALRNAQLGLDANAYTAVRQLIDASMRGSFKYVIYSALLANLLLVIATAKAPGSLLFITAAIAFVALVADTLITVKGNLPINDIINTWTPDNIPANWMEYRTKWLTVFGYRQVINIVGFASLVTGIVFRLK